MAEKLNNEEVIIRDATVEDMILVAEMTQELANFHKMPSRAKLSAEELRRGGFESRWPHFQCKIAEVQTTRTVIGFAVYFPTYSSWEGKAMMLQNLFVKDSYRGRGVCLLFCSVASMSVPSSRKSIQRGEQVMRLMVNDTPARPGPSPRSSAREKDILSLCLVITLASLPFKPEHSSVLREAVASGCARLDLHVLAWNKARVLYEMFGAENLTESQGVYNYTLSGEAYTSFACKTQKAQI